MSATTLWHDDFVAAGYRPYRDGLKDHDERDAPQSARMYQGIQQKRVRDARGTRYFMNVDFYDFSRKRDGAPRSISAKVQFSVQDEMAAVSDVSFTAATIAETEAFFADLWHRMGWGYYEIDDESQPAANNLSAFLCPFNDGDGPELPDDFSDGDPCPICGDTGTEDNGGKPRACPKADSPSPAVTEGPDAS